MSRCSKEVQLCANCGCYHCSDFIRAKTKDKLQMSKDKSPRTRNLKSEMMETTSRDYYLSEIEIQITQKPTNKLLKWEDIPESKHLREKLLQFSRIVDSRHILNDFNRLSTDGEECINQPRISNHRSSKIEFRQPLKGIPIVPTTKTIRHAAKAKPERQCILNDNRCLGLTLCGDDPTDCDSSGHVHKKLLI